MVLGALGGDGSRFYEILRYWFERAPRGESTGTSYRIYYFGRYCSEMAIQREVAAFTRGEDPERTLEFVEFGMRRGEVAPDLDPYLVDAFHDYFMDPAALTPRVAGLVASRARRRRRRGRYAVACMVSWRQASGVS